MPGGASAQHLLLGLGELGHSRCPRGGGQHLCSCRNWPVPSGLLGLCLSCRLIKGDGEVLEEIVSKERHKEINKVVGTGHQHELHGGLGTARELLHPEGLCFHPGDELSPASTARAPRVVLEVLQAWAGVLCVPCSKPHVEMGWPSR